MAIGTLVVTSPTAGTSRARSRTATRRNGFVAPVDDSGGLGRRASGGSPPTTPWPSGCARQARAPGSRRNFDAHPGTPAGCSSILTRRSRRRGPAAATAATSARPETQGPMIFFPTRPRPVQGRPPLGTRGACGQSARLRRGEHRRGGAGGELAGDGTGEAGPRGLVPDRRKPFSDDKRPGFRRFPGVAAAPCPALLRSSTTRSGRSGHPHITWPRRAWRGIRRYRPTALPLRPHLGGQSAVQAAPISSASGAGRASRTTPPTSRSLALGADFSSERAPPIPAQVSRSPRRAAPPPQPAGEGSSAAGEADAVPPLHRNPRTPEEPGLSPGGLLGAVAGGSAFRPAPGRPGQSPLRRAGPRANPRRSRRQEFPGTAPPYHPAAGDAAWPGRLYAAARAGVFPKSDRGGLRPATPQGPCWQGVPCVYSDLPVLRENGAGAAAVLAPTAINSGNPAAWQTACCGACCRTTRCGGAWRPGQGRPCRCPPGRDAAAGAAGRPYSFLIA